MSAPFPPDAPYETGLPRLRTPRLTLRPLVLPDDDALVELFSDALALETWTQAPFTSSADAHVYRATLALGFASRASLVWGVETPDGTLAGIGVLVRWAPSHRRVTLGYFLGSAHWGQGYATEVAAALAAFAFDGLDVWRVEAETVEENAASRRVLEKVGFVFEARLVQRIGGTPIPVDADLFRLLRPEWEAR